MRICFAIVNTDDGGEERFVAVSPGSRNDDVGYVCAGRVGCKGLRGNGEEWG